MNGNTLQLLLLGLLTSPPGTDTHEKSLDHLEGNALWWMSTENGVIGPFFVKNRMVLSGDMPITDTPLVSALSFEEAAETPSAPEGKYLVVGNTEIECDTPAYASFLADAISSELGMKAYVYDDKGEVVYSVQPS